MKGPSILDRRAGGGQDARRQLAQTAAARERRARKHLARKRERERRRLVRERRRGEAGPSSARQRAGLGLALFTLALAVGLTIGGPTVSRLWLSRVPLEAVRVQGARALDAETIARETGLVPGMPLSAIDPEAVVEALSHEPWIESTRVLTLPTGTVVVSVVERRAIARLREHEEGETWLVDGQGRRFAGAIEAGGALPLVEGTLPEAETLPDAALEILAALREQPRFDAVQETLTLVLPGRVEGNAADPHEGFVLELGEDGPRALLGRTALARRVARLSRLLDEGATGADTARWIDLRYADRAVLQTEPVSG